MSMLGAGGRERSQPFFLGFGDIQHSLGARVYLSSLLNSLCSRERPVPALFFQQTLPGSSAAGNGAGSLVAVDPPMRGLAGLLPRGLWRAFEFVWANGRGLTFALASRRHHEMCLFSGAGLLPLMPILRGWYRTVVYVQHGIAEESQLAGGARGNARYRLFRTLERRFLPLADCVITVSNQMAEYCRKEYHVEKALVVPCCVDIAAFSQSHDDRAEMRQHLGVQDRVVVVYSGGAAPWQCVDQSVRLFHALRSAVPNAFLLVLSGDTAAWQQALRGLGPADHRVMKVPHHIVGRYLCAADVALLLRRRSLVNSVASPVKFAEYLASGLPVITSPFIGDYSAMVRDQQLGVLVDPDDESTWPAGISAATRMAADPAVRARCRLTARRLLSWDVVGESVMAALRDVRRPARGRQAGGSVNQHVHQ